MLLGLLIIVTKRLHGHLTLDGHAGVQKVHKAPTPRIGGVALLAGAVAGGVGLPPETQGLWWLILLTSAPAFLFGLIEDLTKRVSVKARLLATICAGLLYCLASGYFIDRLGIPGLDVLFAAWLPAVLFTGFAIGGIANAINIIDGVNGLASGTSILILVGFAAVAWQAGDQQIMAVCLVAIGALAGFFLLNFPLGKIFLGDAGAYATGFLLAVVAVTLPARNPDLSPLIGLLALSYPVIETMVSIHRRVMRSGSHPGQPDRLHLHSLIYRSRARQIAQAIGAPNLRNALTGLLVMVLPLLATVLMVGFATSTPLILLSIAAILLIYLRLYRRVALLSRSEPGLAARVKAS
ncbi:glycosyltransferase [Rhodobacter sp.]